MPLILRTIAAVCAIVCIIVAAHGGDDSPASRFTKLSRVAGLLTAAAVCTVLSLLLDFTALGVLNTVACLAVLAFCLFLRNNARAHLPQEDDTDTEKEDTNAVRR